METVTVLLKWNEPNRMVEELLVSLYPRMRKEGSEASSMLFRVDTDTLDLAFEDLYDLLIEDFQMRFTLLVLPEVSSTLLPPAMWDSLAGTLKPGYYDLETALIQAKRTLPSLLGRLRETLHPILSTTDITTVLALADANMNISTAAKRLYIHRNTMLYRLDHVTRVTGIDVKTFKGLFIMYSLYKTY